MKFKQINESLKIKKKINTDKTDQYKIRVN